MLTLQNFQGNGNQARGLRRRVLSVYRRVMPEIRWPANNSSALNNGNYSFELFQDLPEQTRERITQGFRAGRLPRFNPNAPLEDDGNTLRVAVAEGILYDLLDTVMFEVEDREQQREEEVHDLVDTIISNVIREQEVSQMTQNILQNVIRDLTADDISYNALADALAELSIENAEDSQEIYEMLMNEVREIENELDNRHITLPNVPAPAIDYEIGGNQGGGNQGGGNQGGINVPMSNFQASRFSDTFDTGMSNNQRRQRIRKFWKQLDQRIIKHPDRKIPKLVDIIRVRANKYIL